MRKFVYYDTCKKTCLRYLVSLLCLLAIIFNLGSRIFLLVMNYTETIKSDQKSAIIRCNLVVKFLLFLNVSNFS